MSWKRKAVKKEPKNRVLTKHEGNDYSEVAVTKAQQKMKNLRHSRKLQKKFNKLFRSSSPISEYTPWELKTNDETPEDIPLDDLYKNQLDAPICSKIVLEEEELCKGDTFFNGLDIQDESSENSLDCYLIPQIRNGDRNSATKKEELNNSDFKENESMKVDFTNIVDTKYDKKVTNTFKNYWSLDDDDEKNINGTLTLDKNKKTYSIIIDQNPRDAKKLTETASLYNSDGIDIPCEVLDTENIISLEKTAVVDGTCVTQYDPANLITEVHNLHFQKELLIGTNDDIAVAHTTPLQIGQCSDTNASFEISSQVPHPTPNRNIRVLNLMDLIEEKKPVSLDNSKNKVYPRIKTTPKRKDLQKHPGKIESMKKNLIYNKYEKQTQHFANITPLNSCTMVTVNDSNIKGLENSLTNSLITTKLITEAPQHMTLTTHTNTVHSQTVSSHIDSRVPINSENQLTSNYKNKYLYQIIADQNNIIPNKQTKGPNNIATSCASLTESNMPRTNYVQPPNELLEAIIVVIQKNEDYHKNINNNKKFTCFSEKLTSIDKSQLSEIEIYLWDMCIRILHNIGIQNIHETFWLDLEQKTKIYAVAHNMLPQFPTKICNYVINRLRHNVQSAYSNKYYYPRTEPGIMKKNSGIPKGRSNCVRILPSTERQHTLNNRHNKQYPIVQTSLPVSRFYNQLYPDHMTFASVNWNLGSYMSPIKGKRPSESENPVNFVPNYVSHYQNARSYNYQERVPPNQCRQNCPNQHYEYSKPATSQMTMLQPLTETNEVVQQNPDECSQITRTFMPQEPVRSSISRDSGFMSPTNNTAFEPMQEYTPTPHHNSTHRRPSLRDVAPMTSASSQSPISKPCTLCKVPTILRCQGCNEAFYCSSLCFVTDWHAIHKYQCSQAFI